MRNKFIELNFNKMSAENLNWSDSIYYLGKKYIKLFDIEIDYYCSLLPKDIAGQCDYQARKITLNEIRSFYALLTLIHELGHFASYLKNKNIEKGIKREKRELLAYLHGWKIITQEKVNIHKKDWKWFHNL